MVTQGVRDPGAAAPSGFSNSAEAPCGQYEPPAMLRGSGDTEERTEVSSNAAEEGVRRPQHPSWTSEVALPPGSGERGTQSAPVLPRGRAAQSAISQRIMARRGLISEECWKPCQPEVIECARPQFAEGRHPESVHLSYCPIMLFSNHAGASCGQYEPPARLRSSGGEGECTGVPSNCGSERGKTPYTSCLVSEARLCLGAVESEGHSPAPGMLQELL